MFQNLSKNTEEVFDEDVEFATESSDSKTKQILRKNFSIPNIIIYIMSFMISLIGGNDSSIFTSVAPFGYAITAASFGAGVPAAIVCVLTLIGTGIKFGGSGLLFYILTLLVFVAFILIKRPIEQEGRNEEFKVGIQMSFAVFAVQMGRKNRTAARRARARPTERRDARRGTHRCRTARPCRPRR